MTPVCMMSMRLWLLMTPLLGGTQALSFTSPYKIDAETGAAGRDGADGNPGATGARGPAGATGEGVAPGGGYR